MVLAWFIFPVQKEQITALTAKNMANGFHFGPSPRSI